MTKVVVVVSFLVAFAAGLVVGAEVRRAGSPPAKGPGRHGGWLAAELSLSAAQQEQLEAIWSETASQGRRQREERRRDLYRQRDEAIAALVRPEDRPRYDAILQNHADQMTQLESEWRSSFEAAVERTKQILTPEQRVKYEEVVQRHQGGREPWERHRGERGPSAGDGKDRGAASCPAAPPPDGRP